MRVLYLNTLKVDIIEELGNRKLVFSPESDAPSGKFIFSIFT